MSEQRGQALEIGGREIPCPVCGHDRFWKRKSLMNTRGATFFGLDWADRSATNYVCEECGHVLWFLKGS